MPKTPFLSLPDVPALIAGHGRLSLLTPDGELLSPTREETADLLAELPPPLLIHGPATLRALHLTAPPAPTPWLDLLDLFLFCRPAQSVAPTPRGMAHALGIPAPKTIEADFLPRLAETLLDELSTRANTPAASTMRAHLSILAASRWSWSGIVATALGDDTPPRPARIDALRIWRTLPKWEDTAPRPAPGSKPVSPTAARERLSQMLGPNAETRAGQADFASVATHAFNPREALGIPQIVLAEAGTGTGKTLGYIAPASLWAESNGGAVWISTYTRHLQRQIDQEMRRLHPDPLRRRNTVVVRKGRENYLCLLNMEDILNTTLSRADAARAASPALIPLTLLARWAESSADGDLSGGDLPGWFGELYGHSTLQAVADRRGECIHGACPHYQRCFVEHTIRRARDADLVIANHALIMAQAAWSATAHPGTPEEDTVPTRYIFDEGHHLPDAADSAFSTTLSGLEAAELRRWLLGAEGSRSRARGLRRRLDDLVSGLPRLEAPMDAVLQAARALPAPGWTTRLHTPEDKSPPPTTDPANPFTALFSPNPVTITPELTNPAETFLAELDRQLLARGKSAPTETRFLSRECDLHPASDAVIEAAQTLSRALSRLSAPLHTLVERLAARLNDEAEELDTTTRTRIEAMIRALSRRAIARVDGWVAMLDQVPNVPEADTTPTFIDFIRSDPLPGPGRQGRDVGLCRHWLDPTIPFAGTIQLPAHGMLITSATLRDRPQANTPETASNTTEAAWTDAEARLGTPHFQSTPLRAALMSPFDYARQSRAYIVTDVARDNPDALASAYRSLFLASGGGALGLFTAISRLRAVHSRILPALEEAGFPLYAQHVDAMDNATLVDIFRTETDSCLLGTDAMRDGVDVPGRALRLVAFERVPWPRPDILHRERRLHLSGGMPADYDDRIARMRLRQAFGRLVRKVDDRGVFVLLDRRTPTRLFSAFPQGVEIKRMGIADIVKDIAEFLHTSPHPPSKD